MFDAIKDYLQFAANYSRIFNDKTVPLQPNFKLNASLIYSPVRSLQIHYSYRKVSQRFYSEYVEVASGDFSEREERLPSYSISDVALNKKIISNMDFIFKVNNLFDKKYEEVHGYGTYGRNYYASLQWEL
jgi:vitamin B12 transporter